ncbi:MAG: alpha/beta hydrolase [Lentisphaerota bacterium]
MMTLKWELLMRWSWIVIVPLFVWGYLRYFEWRNVFYPSREFTATPADFGLEFEDVLFVAEDGGLLHGWWIPCANAVGTMIYCHGNAGNISDRAWMMADLHRLGVNLFIFDYRGYGKSKGIPTEKGTYRDARAAYEVVRARYEDSEQPPIIVYGHSLGGAVAVQLACDKPVRGLVVESTFSSTVDMGHFLYPMLPVDLLLHFRYDSISKIKNLRIPKLFSHGRPDQTVPFELGKKLFEAACEPKQFVELPGGHDDVAWMDSREYWDALKNFIARTLPAAP